MRKRFFVVKQQAKHSLKSAINWLRQFSPWKSNRESDALYKLLYMLVHDKERSLELSALQTQQSFSKQWSDLQTGNALLSDAWFKQNVTRIICEEELLLKPEWFEGKRVLDAGCGNGRWCYGLAKLGAEVTAVDINTSALESARKALAENNLSAKFVQSPLETLDQVLGNEQFDLVFSWGVVHHCISFNESMKQLGQRVKDGGILYLYLYGRESMSFEVDLELFKQRITYNTLASWPEKEAFLLKKANGDPAQVHIAHDVYAPLLNRRLEFDEVQAQLQSYGFLHIERTIDHTELFVRAVKGTHPIDPKWLLSAKQKPFWFERYQ
jgi:2-polyprenyl-3-methyl-5-hydroxy-6-metoxy-1,4-benzoquinol methylase